jgi:hypothetical protein
MNRRAIFAFMVLALLAALGVSSRPAWSQVTLSTGSIEGTLTDPQGAVVVQAKVMINSRSTGTTTNPVVTSAGTFNSGPLSPGEYVVRIEANGFKTVQMPVTVQVGNIASASTVLQLGASSSVITVESGAETVNLEQATIQGVVTEEQIDNLPINGRNFLDLAQLQPGVQIQDGGNFDPTKKGFASVSFGGRFGRTARIEVDGLDISDENVGTTTQNLPMNSIQEFQASQSSLDISTELTSSGTLNVTTKSGGNDIHGEGALYGYRDNGISAVPSVFNQKEYGGDLGGPIIKNKLFAFGAIERTELSLNGAVVPTYPFDGLAGAVGSPFHDTELVGKLDYNLNSNIHAFFKFGYEQNRDVASFVPGTYEPFANHNNTPSYAGGVDFTTGKFTHSFRVGYFKFRNGIAAAPLPEGDFNPAPDISLAVGNVTTACTISGDLWCSGLNILAPQTTFQTDKQFKYDGTRIIGTHTLRYGVGVNRILGGGGADFFGLGPAVRAQVTGLDTTDDGCSKADPCLSGTAAFAAGDPFGAGGITNPMNWPVHRVDVANGEGCFTEIPQFGQACGGQYDTRFEAYVADTWKVRSGLTVNYGLKYNRDTGRTDSDLGPVDALNAFQPGLGNSVRQPELNFGGILGVAWDPWKTGKTVFRAGAGIYYENVIFNNTLFDRPGRLTQGLFNQSQEICTQGGVIMPGDTDASPIVAGVNIPTQICGDNHAIGSVESDIVAVQNAFQAATEEAGPQANGSNFASCGNSTACTGSMFGPNFRSPRSYQMNIGVQRELRPGTVLSVDYLRNVDVHIAEGIDFNHVGDARFLDTQTASNAINATNASFGCPGGIPGVTCAINSDTASGCAVDAGGDPLLGAHLCDYAGNGLAGGTNATGGTAPGPGALAFPGVNPNYGQILLLEPVGRAVYNSLQVSLRSQWNNPLPGIKHMDAQVSYALSRLLSDAQDLDFVNQSLDYDHPTKYMGPNSLDRTHQFSAGVVADLPWGFKTNFITHWYSALPQNIVAFAPGNAEDIFQYDFDGTGETPSGTVPIPLEGGHVGQFGRSVKASDLASYLNNYSSNFGNQLTPAGQALVNNDLMTADQLSALCAVTPSVNPVNGCATPYPQLQLPGVGPHQAGNSPLFTFDMTIGYSIKPIRSWESFRIEPTVTIFNLFNRANFNDALSLLGGVLDGNEGSIGATTAAQRRADSIGRIGLGSGAFAFGSARTVEFGVKLNF